MQTYETIRARLQTKAASRFNCLPDNLSQEARLYIDWMASELGTLHRELQQSNDAVQSRLLQRLRPDTCTRPMPAHGIAYAQPQKQEGHILRPDEDVLTIARYSPTPPQQIFYSPLLPLPIFKARVKYIASGTSFREAVEPTRFQTAATTMQSGEFARPGVLWVGIQMSAPLPPAQPLCFYVDWGKCDTARKNQLYKMLPIVKCLSGVQEVFTKPGLSFDRLAAQRYQSSFVDEEFLHLYNIEHQVEQTYSHQFVTVQADGLHPTPAVPAEFAEKLSEEMLDTLRKDQIAWLRLVFPAGFQPEDLEQIVLQLNCFPVLNRRLDRTRDFEPTGYGHTEIVALNNADRGRAALSEMGSYFLGIQRVFTRNAEYRPVAFDSFLQCPEGTYALQHGHVEADDFRDVYARIGELSHLLRSHASTLLRLPQRNTQEALANIENGTAMLETALQQIPPKDLDLGYYLHLKHPPLEPNDVVRIRFWVTQGEYAHGIASPGDVMEAERNDFLEGGTGRWVG